ncbi:hypothetical protein ACEV76_20785 [Vibrio parahaemolyticus]|uniref:hypothetical protein n=1 Tax=Vibrio parahaemolyticus TaxID=670 RepID=UPI001120BB61|nr:hypothetical protein [Vibrio parahaemolyticus]TOA39870.1 hypothetical protein CGK28_08205 [Vibrio parahaemolyticus]HAS6198724.1 hypothetical protein [Vibrio vulnificus]
MKIITIEDAIKELKNQIAIGSGSLLVGEVNVEYDNQVLVTSGDALDEILKNKDLNAHKIMLRAMLNVYRGPRALYSRTENKIFLITTPDQEKAKQLYRTIKQDHHCD